MFDFKNANENQIKAISACEGPVLITAGPGTGKTFTLVQRALFLIEEKSISPENIMIATFTEKAAKELITRITNELAERNLTANVNEMYVGTFHSICLRILKENLEYTRLKKNYRLLDAFDQQYVVFQNIQRFRSIKNINAVVASQGAWRKAGEICGIVNNLSEEMVDCEKMKMDKNPDIVAVAEMITLYNQIVEKENLVDFSSIQTECYRLLKENDSILESMQEKIQYLMVDEYQDTNYIQEQLVFLLAGKLQNICVVGDDDQGLYRFRGATIRNILEFPNKFDEGMCTIVPLVVNYRSNSDIIDFYNMWMSTTSGRNFKFNWENYRFSKKIIPANSSTVDSPSVVKLSSVEDEDEWHEKLLTFINKLKNAGKITDYNQLAFLFSSVKHERVTNLADFLEENGINVYSPRSDMFFEREEIKTALGFLMLLIPQYVQGLENGEYQYLQSQHYRYYEECIENANRILSDKKNIELKKWIRQHGGKHFSLSGTTDYAYSGLLYQLFAFEPFKSILDIDMNAGVTDIRASRNLALFTQIIGKYEYIQRITVFNGKNITCDTERLFNLYLRLLFDGGISEYEDDSEYAPSGCVSFLTIHQSKGMEFPIVFVDSLSNFPKKQGKEILRVVEEKYFHRTEFEPHEQMKYFDFWRLYYTAFSRAQDLLVLTCNETNRSPSKYFVDIYNGLTDVDNEEFKINEFDFSVVKDVNIKDTFSFTSHIAVYETCSLQYKFYKELEFMPVRQGAMLFGVLVHETIEDIHRAAIRKETDKITKENIVQWFETNYNSLIQREHGYLAEPQRQAALEQVQRYAERQEGRWESIQQAEVDVSLVQPDYIIEGKIDLVKGADGKIELVDFKSEKKPDMVLMRERIEHYRRQLHIYAYLIEQRTGQKVSKMHLYYTGEENGNPMISFPYTKSAIEGTVEAFDSTVHKILRKEYTQCSNSTNTCQNCDFRFYCGRN